MTPAPQASLLMRYVICLDCSAMCKPLPIRALIVFGLFTTVLAETAIAQDVLPEPAAVPMLADTPRVTVRLHAGPSLNMMSDWRDGMSALADMASARGLSPSEKSCICMTWGATTLIHVSDRVALGGVFEMLRDTRSFTVNDQIRGFGIPTMSGTFSFRNEAVVQTLQGLVDVYPRDGSRVHLQVGAGTANGHTSMSTPGSTATSRVRGTMVSTSIGTEGRFWYMDAGWRFLPMRTTAASVNDFEIDEPRDVFPSVSAVGDFASNRKTDLSGGWVRAGIALHFGRR